MAVLSSALCKRKEALPSIRLQRADDKTAISFQAAVTSTGDASFFVSTSLVYTATGTEVQVHIAAKTSDRTGAQDRNQSISAASGRGRTTCRPPAGSTPGRTRNAIWAAPVRTLS